jgi:Na+-driven multidrug efflux pump
MQTEDLTKGAMATHFRNLAIPAALGMLFATLYNVANSIPNAQFRTQRVGIKCQRQR